MMTKKKNTTLKTKLKRIKKQVTESASDDGASLNTILDKLFELEERMEAPKPWLCGKTRAEAFDLDEHHRAVKTHTCWLMHKHKGYCKCVCDYIFND